MENVMPETVPDAILAFITEAVIPGDLTLPFHYPQPEQWHAWHCGFRWHGVTGKARWLTPPGCGNPAGI